MKTWDAVIIGSGIIGLSLALELRKHQLTVAVIDRTEPGREASSAAGGMIAHADPHTAEPLIPAVLASAAMYPEYIHELQDESAIGVDLRNQGTISFGTPGTKYPCAGPYRLSADDLARLEPNISPREDGWYLPEISIDVRALMQALVTACKHRDVHLAIGTPATDVIVQANKAVGVRTEKTQFTAGAVINCAGAWADQVAPIRFPIRPVKGHMLAVVSQQMITGEENSPNKTLVQHVVRNPGIVYIVPRSDGRHIIGSTLEEAGYDKRVDPDVIQRLHQAAANLVPELGESRILEAWTGLRPTSPDKLPLLGPTSIAGYFLATGHYRDGILLAPATAKCMGQIIRQLPPDLDLAAFSPQRFEG